MSEIRTDTINNASGDNDSGIDLSTNDQVSIKTANTTALTVDASQNVGIGTSSPSAKLDVVTDSTNDDGISITADGTSFGYASNIYFNSKLTVGGSIGVAAKIRAALESSNNAGLQFFTTLSGTNAERMRIGNDGATTITSLAGSNYVLRLHNDRNNNDGYGLRTQVGTDAGTGTHYHIDFADGDDTLQGSITSDSGTVTYGPFTAHHPCIIPDADNDADSVDRAYPYGTLLEITSLSYTQKNGVNTERGILYNVQKSSSAKSKAVIGAYGSSMNSAERGDTNLHQALILGDGHILCNNENGNIEIGDYICTSSTSGEGMKATSICTTIGIAREAVTFTDSTAVLVAVEYGYRQFIPEDLEARIVALENA